MQASWQRVSEPEKEHCSLLGAASERVRLPSAPSGPSTEKETKMESLFSDAVWPWYSSLQEERLELHFFQLDLSKAGTC